MTRLSVYLRRLDVPTVALCLLALDAVGLLVPPSGVAASSVKTAGAWTARADSDAVRVAGTDLASTLVDEPDTVLVQLEIGERQMCLAFPRPGEFAAEKRLRRGRAAQAPVGPAVTARAAGVSAAAADPRAELRRFLARRGPHRREAATSPTLPLRRQGELGLTIKSEGGVDLPAARSHAGRTGRKEDPAVYGSG